MYNFAVKNFFFSFFPPAAGTDKSPVDIARDAYNFAVQNDFDTIIVDTAGRQVLYARL